MLIKVKSVALHATSCIEVLVEVNIANRGLPSFDIVGLASKAVYESRERVKSAIRNSGFDFPTKRITVNLAPADLPKEGSFYDLPIAIAIICGSKGILVPENALFFGELSLDGTLRHIRGAISLALYAKEFHISQLFVPAVSAGEAACIKDIKVYGVSNLRQVIAHLSEGHKIIPMTKSDTKSLSTIAGIDFKNIIGQYQAKRALEIAAAGKHSLLLVGPPGVGKSLLAKAFAGILPPLTYEESLEVTKIYSIAGLIPPNGGVVTERQLRAPHHTISYSGLIGGGLYPAPGEISLAHRGVLFMDEFAEFSRGALESLRQPMEDGFITISRTKFRFTYPANFLLLAASNPCPCGYAGYEVGKCVCTQAQLTNYNKKLSGPLRDRIDMFVRLSNVEVKELINFSGVSNGHLNAESSNIIKHRVVGAHKRQLHRFNDVRLLFNSEIKNEHLSTFCTTDDTAKTLFSNAIQKLNISARGYFKVLKVARTIADLDASTVIRADHILEALQYRFI